MEQLILVFYINVSGFSQAKAYKLIDECKQDFEARIPKDEKGINKFFCIFLPVYDENSRVECINPKYISYQEHKKLLSLTKTYTNNLITTLSKSKK